MNKHRSISVVISSFNSEKKIEECLKSVSWAHEIIVVDGTSTDKTLEIVKKYTTKIFVRPNHKMLNINKNFGFSKATGDWILSLDTDERVTPELAKEIKLTIEQLNNGAIDGFWIPRKNIIFGKWMEHTGWYPDLQLRLFKWGKGRFAEEHVHEMVKVEGGIGELKGHILHYNYDSISQFLQKLGTIYGPNEAEQLIKKGYVFDWRDSIRFPAKEFLSRFFAREGYKDRFHGLILSLLMAFYHFIVFAYIWEKHKFKQINDEAILIQTEKEMTQSSKDLFFWFSKEKTKLIKNPLKKIFHKILRKVTS
ncbi:MAG: glycosyltransferase family 2 protein [bacterium]|nr:glycosyltransferase family 2 protein [bacterium]